MELGSIFLVLAVVLLIGVYIFTPFTKLARHARSSESLEVSALKAERDRVINSLQEGADILRKLDELAPVSTSAIQAEARIEQAAAAGRADSASDAPALDVSDDDLESMIVARRKAHKSKSAGFCPKCGKPVLVTDKFCPSCGKSL